MTSTANRSGRRRRMLQDGASAPQAGSASTETPQTERVRYTPPAESASFAVASRVVPGGLFGMACLGAASLAVTAALGWADGFGAQFAQSGVNAAAARLFMVDHPGSLMAWWEASLWLAVTCQCVLLFGMRRHRTDDLGGAYRWWFVVAATSVGLSVASATHLHLAFASEVAQRTGFSPMEHNAFWWLVPGGVVLAGVGLKTFFEIKESRVAALLAGIAGVAAVVSGASSAGLLAPMLGAVAPWAASPVVAPVAGATVALAVLLSLSAYSRRIVQETLGEVAPPAEKKSASAKRDDNPADDSEGNTEAKAKATAPAAESEPVVEQVRPKAEKPAAKRAEKPSKPTLAMQTTSTEWVSGGEDYSEDYDDQPKRKLSKAERKRLRREKARRAA